MISFQLTDEQEVVRDAMRDFAAEALRPIARECDEESKLSEEALSQTWELGLVSTQLPEEFGGGGEPRSPITQALLLEELAWGDATLTLAALAPAAFAFAIVDLRDGRTKARVPASLLRRELFHAASLAVVEAGPNLRRSCVRVTVAEPHAGRLRAFRCQVLRTDGGSSQPFYRGCAERGRSRRIHRSAGCQGFAGFGA